MSFSISVRYDARLLTLSSHLTMYRPSLFNIFIALFQPEMSRLWRGSKQSLLVSIIHGVLITYTPFLYNTLMHGVLSYTLQKSLTLHSAVVLTLNTTPLSRKARYCIISHNSADTVNQFLILKRLDKPMEQA